MSLSAKFAQIAAAKATNPSIITNNRNVKRSIVASVQKDKRTTTIAQKRGLVVIKKPASIVKSGKPGVRPSIRINGKPGSGGRTLGGRKPRVMKGKGKGSRREKKEPIKAEDLDRELGMYLHKAGKGPNPMETELDDMLDNYKKAKAT